MRLAITGGSGFVGSTVVPSLAKSHEIEIYDVERPPASILDSDGVTYRQLDILNRDLCREAISDVDAVFHKVGLKGGVNSLEQPRQYYEVNVRGVLNVIEACRINGIDRFCFDSTESVFGTTDNGAPFIESDCPHPSSMYGGTKRIAEGYLSAIDNMSSTILRYPRIVSSSNSNAITRFYDMISNDKSITVYGDGSQSFDFVHVEDVKEAHDRVIQKDFPEEIFHIATTDSIRLLDLISKIGEFADRNIEYECVDRGSLDDEYIEDDLLPHENSLAVEKSREELGMVYEFPKVEDVLRSVLSQLSKDED